MVMHCKSKRGFTQYPHVDLPLVQDPAMAIMDVARRNFVAWRALHPEAGTLKQIASKAGVGFGTAQRLFVGDGNITVEKLEAIAGVFHRSATDLLTDHSPEETARYTRQVPARVCAVEEPPADERLLLLGFRAASEELRDVMLEVARRSLYRKEPHGRSDHQ